MLATLYTDVPLPFGVMRKGLHKNTPQAILARNLKAAFKARDLSARSVMRALQAKGTTISNKTISNMLNGDGNPQLEGLMAVADLIRVPLWQLLCPAVEISHVKEEEVHDLLDDFLSLSELGRKRVRRNIRGEAAVEQMERAENLKPDASSETQTST